jgi:hypothetical protein
MFYSLAIPLVRHVPHLVRERCDLNPDGILALGVLSLQDNEPLPDFINFLQEEVEERVSVGGMDHAQFKNPRSTAHPLRGTNAQHSWHKAAKPRSLLLHGLKSC